MSADTNELQQRDRVENTLLLKDLFRRLPKRNPRRKEKTSFALRRSRVPRQHPALAGYVIVIEHASPALYSIEKQPIGFSEAFADYVGEHLPFGICAQKPAMVLYVDRRDTGYKEVVACYTDFTSPTVLWRPEDRPVWLKPK